ncbi:Peptidoglycan glycosyltransferase [Thermoanaerobacter italicus Ab9]|uniref:Peptidoglycan glycosyltransferase n=2 Tax=Thermoanaerobacter TaxID=1754 RepID=D3T459_THEIA|nr:MULTISPECIES: penicillin-binding transpeptidase domain-containing protein [Thermoanaerobacter]ADD03011.1 Peptidoglycan glycosyltransferase [Thermoanaerobacter italicus Ab9]MDP9751399.1 peptidoglycan glycosyltransferase [Thermoanaerobacter pentosaceus]
MPNLKHNIKILFWVFSALFFSLIAYLTYFQIYERDKLITSSYSIYNKRLIEEEKKILRGSILDRNGIVLAKSVEVDGVQKREYLDGPAFAHVIGYSRRIYQQGNTGIEKAYDRELLGMVGNDPMTILRKLILARKKVGDNVYLTIDKALQDLAYKEMEGKKGAVVALNPKTGEILAMVSTPSYDPNTLGENWEEIMTSSEHVVLNRATQGLYPPGSTFKIITTAAALTYKPELYDKTFNCKGYIIVDGDRINDFGGIAHGIEDFKQAFYRSCNSFFIQLGLDLGSENLQTMAYAFGLNKGVPLEIDTVKNQFPPLEKRTSLAETSIGQGEMLVTPLSMALVASAVANDGVMMKPHLMKYVVDSISGAVIEKSTPSQYLNPISKKVAYTIKQLMIGAVNDKEGTGKAAQISGVTVAGKTGTAENPHGAPHAWFVGFAPAENPQIVVSVIVENGGQGGKVAAPIARDIIRAYLSK